MNSTGRQPSGPLATLKAPGFRSIRGDRISVTRAASRQVEHQFHEYFKPERETESYG